MGQVIAGRPVPKAVLNSRNIGDRAAFPPMTNDQGIVQDERGQDQPKDKKRAQQPGLKEQREAAETQPSSPGQPANGE